MYAIRPGCLRGVLRSIFPEVPPPGIKSDPRLNSSRKRRIRVRTRLGLLPGRREREKVPEDFGKAPFCEGGISAFPMKNSLFQIDLINHRGAGLLFTDLLHPFPDGGFLYFIRSVQNKRMRAFRRSDRGSASACNLANCRSISHKRRRRERFQSTAEGKDKWSGDEFREICGDGWFLGGGGGSRHGGVFPPGGLWNIEFCSLRILQRDFPGMRNKRFGFLQRLRVCELFIPERAQEFRIGRLGIRSSRDTSTFLIPRRTD